MSKSFSSLTTDINQIEIFEKHKLDKCVDSFKNFILKLNLTSTKEKINHSHLKLLSEQAFEGTIEEKLLRPLLWKIVLGYYPSNSSLSEWVSSQKEIKSTYKQKLKSINSLKHFSSDPLGNGNSEWSNFFEDTESKNLIIKDIDRTFQEKELFQSKAIKDMLCSCLLLWSKENKDTKYCQGMNEVIGLVLLSLHPYYFSSESEKGKQKIQNELPDEIEKINWKDLYIHMNNLDNLSSDCYFLYSSIMSKGVKFFFSKYSIKEIEKTDKNIQNLMVYFSKLDSSFNKNTNNDCLKTRLDFVFSILEAFDKRLYDFLISKSELEFYMIGQRWYRCLFSREFHYLDSLKILDCIFSIEYQEEEKGFCSLFEYFTCAMILYVKDELYQKDKIGCFMRLNKYPPVESVMRLINTSIGMKRKYEKEKEKTERKGSNSKQGLEGVLVMRRVKEKDSIIEKVNVYNTYKVNELGIEIEKIMEKYKDFISSSDLLKITQITEAMKSNNK